MQKKVQGKRKLRARHFFLCCAAGLFLLGSVFLSQNAKLREIGAEQQALQAEYEVLLLEEERLSRMVWYASTDEYLEQQIREKLGYVHPEDHKFFMEEITP